MSPGESLHLAHLEPDEIAFLGCLNSTMSLDEVGIDVVWLRVAPGERWWVIDTPLGRASLRVSTTEPADTSPAGAVQRWLPIPLRLLRVAVSDSEPGDTATGGPALLSLVDGRTAVLSCPATSGAIDLVEGVTPPTRLTWIESSGAVVPTNRLAGMFWSAYAIPNQARERRTTPYPPMWLRLDDSGVTMHIDWADAGSGRATYRCAGQFEGDPVTVSMLPEPLNSFVHQLAFETPAGTADPKCLVRVGRVEFDDEEGSRRRAIELRRGQAMLVAWVTDPLADRWGTEVVKGIDAADVELIGHDETEWLVRSYGVDVRITLHHGHPDHVRIASAVWTAVDETFELLHEINQLNGVSTGPRFVVADGDVWVVADIACTDKGQIAASVTRVVDDIVTQARRYAPLLGALVT